ncbi:MAG: TIGR04255 family protein [Acidobacteria bacterium]|nr:TIGR04255 family protein [Acidobacteriota bacterium]
MSLRIDLAETFPLLGRAPIVEAVIEVRARAGVAWDESAISERLKPKLPEYPVVESHRGFRHEIRMVPGQPAEQALQDLGWRGLRFESEDKRHIAQFNRDSFVFSRLTPYVSWEQFQKEGLRLWQLHSELAQPAEAQRLGLRFVNRIPAPVGEFQLEDYIEASPRTPRDLDIPLVDYLDRRVLNVPGYPYNVAVIQTVQHPQGEEAMGVGLILDIDVFTTTPSSPGRDVVEKRLAEMRWLKNKVFFGSITPKTLEMLK